MNKTEKIVLGVVVLGLVVVGYWAKTPVKQEVSYEQIINAINSKGDELGALSNPDLISNWFSFGGTREWAYKSNMLSSGVASTTVCSFRSPNATTTLEMVSANIATSSFATSIDIGYSQGLSSTTDQVLTPALPTATTTIIARANLALNAYPYFLNATSSLTGTTTEKTGMQIQDNIIFPRSYINVKVGPQSSTTNLIGGTCKVKFLEL